MRIILFQTSSFTFRNLSARCFSRPWWNNDLNNVVVERLSSNTDTVDGNSGAISSVNSLMKRMRVEASATATNSDSVVLVVIAGCLRHNQAMEFPYRVMRHPVVDLYLLQISRWVVFGGDIKSTVSVSVLLEKLESAASDPKSASTNAERCA